MPPSRISEGAEAARAAALQAEFNEKKWVWIPDEKEGYLGGWVVEEDGDIGEVVMATGGEVSKSHHKRVRSLFKPIFRYGKYLCMLCQR